ncbi:uncharacterized protein FIBRA_06790 [Fibroporia radiculosa]|uniref:D-lactate dehydrogenase (cytochrome) n=1 Tax=Fibroporia radiculosa TaxID=599839 RepID=J4GCI3_9APHY|nr:uncharacterized protein FIBRA_06790 [Fibroporia radiculosa]CCM04608.1 predicted protein [Fibroporia radiculosa]
MTSLLGVVARRRIIALSRSSKHAGVSLGGSRNNTHSSAGRQATARRTVNTTLLFGCALSASLGYYAANSAAARQSAPLNVSKTPSGLNDQYGTLEDFQLAISQLRQEFDPDAVTTDAEDLRVHGYSENDYHPEDDSDLVCQPGVHWMHLNDALKKKGIPLFFPLDPAPGATIGGMISTGCSGTNAVRYGTAKGEWILNVTVVLPNGEVIKTRRRSRKSSAGFDTTKLFIGAEGTLGIITEATIRLAPLMPTSVAVVQFPDVRQATQAVIEVMNKGVGIQCIELCDSEHMRATNVYGMSSRKWPEKDSLFIKFQGPTPRSIQESAEIVREIVKKYDGTGFEHARTEKEAADLWMDRKNALYSGLALVEGSRGWSTDVCVPVSRLPDLVYQTKDDIQKSGIVSTMVGHVGDGNFHALLLFKTDEELETCRHVVHRMVERALALDGTCTGEHGVGIGKRKYLVDELGEGTVELMKTIKRTLDPYNLFNPGKLYPDADQSKFHPSVTPSND